MSEETFIERLKRTPLKLMVVIVDWNNVEMVKDIMREHYIRFKYVCNGRGTANSDLLELLGIGRSDKGIVFCLHPGFLLPEVMWELSDRLSMRQAGHGISFIIPLSGVSGIAEHMAKELADYARDGFNKLSESLPEAEKERFISFHKNISDKWEAHLKMDALLKAAVNDCSYDLILALVNQGYSDDLMEKAGAAGARGGTIISARRIGTDDSSKFFGITVQAEKEIIAILAKHDAKNDIMKAINQYYGMATDAKGVVFSIPVDNVAGLK